MKQGSSSLMLSIMLFFLCADKVYSAPVNAITDLQPTLIVLSIDSFRNDYLETLSVPTLSALAQKGVHAPLIAVFPSITFPNHYSIATGLYPEHHGIIMNEFVSKTMKEPFTYTGHRPTVKDPEWWKGEPIWVSAEKQGQRTASALWPVSGFAVQGVRTAYYEDYPEDAPPDAKVDRILAWLDLPQKERPTLLLGYFENLDNAGHAQGPRSQAVRDTAKTIDAAIGRLLQGLQARGIAQKVNLVILSDHGMSPINPKKVIDLMQIIPEDSLQAITDSDAVVAVYPKPEQLEAVYERLRHTPGMRTYRDTDIPSDFHFRSTHTPPILCVADEEGYLLAKQKEPQKGTHGYSPQLQSMQAVFIGVGPAFREKYTRGAIANIHLYSLFAHLLGLQPVKTDGTLSSLRDILKVSPSKRQAASGALAVPALGVSRVV